MAPAAMVVLLYLLNRARQPLSVLALVGAFLYRVHPVVIVSVTCAFVAWARLRKPKVRVDEGSPDAVHGARIMSMMTIMAMTRTMMLIRMMIFLCDGNTAAWLLPGLRADGADGGGGGGGRAGGEVRREEDAPARRGRLCRHRRGHRRPLLRGAPRQGGVSHQADIIHAKLDILTCAWSVGGWGGG
jgi:hypothetical protein